MTKPTFVEADKMKTLEQYGAALICGMVSLQSLEKFHIQAYGKGMLEEDEAELGKTICWEIQRLLALYKTQFENINERCPMDKTGVMEALQAMTSNKRKAYD